MATQNQNVNGCGCLLLLALGVVLLSNPGGWTLLAVVAAILLFTGGAKAAGTAGRPHVEPLGRSFLQCLAKIAKSDGRVSEAEARLIGDLIRQNYPEVLHKEVKAIFNAARDDDRSFEFYCRVFASHAMLLNREGRLPFLAIFCQLAIQDGASPEKMRLLHYAERLLDCTGFVAQCFGEPGSERRGAPPPPPADELAEAYRTLGCQKGCTLAEVKKAYRKKCAEFHPDRLQAKGMPKAYIEYAEEQMKKINLAYDAICRACSRRSGD